MARNLLAAACAFLPLAGFFACAPGNVKVPDADGTPPYSALNVVGNAERFVLFSGEQGRRLALGPGDSVVLIALGEDRDGGLRDVSLMGNVLAVCGDPVQGKGEALKSGSFARRHVIPAAAPGRTAPGSQSLRYVLKASEFSKLCGPGELRAVVGAAGVRTVNHHGVSAMSPSLHFRLAVPAPRLAIPSPAAGKVAPVAGRTAQKPQAPQASRPVFGPIPPWEWPDTPRI